MEKFDEAATVFAELIARNPENVRYHAGRQAAALRSTRMVERWQGEELGIEPYPHPYPHPYPYPYP